MGYVAVRGGTKAIEASIERLRYERIKSGTVLDVDRIQAGMRGLVDQVMSESSLYSEPVAAICIKQAEGSPEEAVFTMRAFRSTLPRKHYSTVVDGEQMRVERRISATFKDIPGGQILGASYDYVHRLVDFSLANETEADATEWLKRWHSQATGEGGPSATDGTLPKVLDYLRAQGLMKPIEPDDSPPKDVTKDSIRFPTARSERLQVMTRGQTGAVTALGYASLRGYGPLLHPTVGELRVGMVSVCVPDPLRAEGVGTRAGSAGGAGGAVGPGDGASDDDSYYIGEIWITEVETVVPVAVPRGQGRTEIEFDIGYGVCFGQNETKAIAMALLDQCLEHPDPSHPTHDEEFVLLHIDSVEATGFISHLKLPHYVTFQSELDSVRKSRRSKQASLADRDVSVPTRDGEDTSRGYL